MYIPWISAKITIKCIPGCFLSILGGNWFQKLWKPLGIIAIFACWHKGKRSAKNIKSSGKHRISWNPVNLLKFHGKSYSGEIHSNLHIQGTVIIQSKFRCFWSAGAPEGGKLHNFTEMLSITLNIIKPSYFCQNAWESTILRFWRALAAPGWKHKYSLRIINGLEGSWTPQIA